MIFWGGVWTSIFLVSLVAVGSLLSPNASSNRTASAVTSDAQPAIETEPVVNREGQVPIWMFGAIVLTCTAGSILITQCLKLSTATKAKGGKRISKALKPRSRPATISQPEYRQPSRELQPFSPTAPLPFPVLPTFVQPPSEPVVLPSTDQKADQNQTQKQSIQEQTALSNLISWLNAELEAPPFSPLNPLDPFTASVQPLPQSTVSVVPVEESHPLDWGDNTVAAAVNRRRLRSLQAWLADS